MMHCSVVGYSLYLIALCAMFPALRPDVLVNDVRRSAPGGQKAEAPRPELPVREGLLYLREFFPDEPAACGFIRIDEPAHLRVRLATEEYADMVCIIRPFF